MNEGLENQNKSLKAFEIEERKLNLTFLLTSQSESPIKLYVKDAIKHYVKDDISSNFDMTLFKIKEILNLLEKIEKNHLDQKENEIVIKIFQILKILQTQYVMIEELYSLIISSEVKKEDVESLIKKNIDLNEFIIQIDDINSFNLTMLLKMDPFFLAMLEKFEKKIQKLLNSWHTRKKKFYFNFLYIYGTKFNYVAEFLPYIVIYPKDDLFCKEKTHEDWLEIQNFYKEESLVSEEEMNRSIRTFGNMLNTACSVYFDRKLRRNHCCDGIKMAKDAIYYLFNSKKAKNVAHLFYSNPDVHTATSIWNIPDKTFAKSFMKLGFPCIKISKKIYLEKTVEPITLENILEEYSLGTINKITVKTTQHSLSQKSNDHEPILSLKTLSTRRPNTIKVRLLSNIKLYGSKISNPSCDTLLIHIHGGGFVSMASNSHQCYTRLFAKRTGVPVFSIDYRLAPQSPYPLGFDDCWQAYNWLINNAHHYFFSGNIPKNIVLCGDSAGGNLVAAITVACIKKGVRKPDGLFLIYPALNTSKKGFTPSYLKAFSDVVLQHTFLKICLNSYVADERLKPDIDPYLSPRLASDEILMEFPPVKIFSAEKDPLSDDSVKFLQKMIRLKKEIDMKTYIGLPHGYMNYDYVGGLSPARLAINDVCFMLNDFLKMLNERKKIQEV